MQGPRRFVLIAVASAVVACADPFTPSVSNVAGDYSATTFTVTDGGMVTDFLADGASLTMTLTTDGTTTGRLFVPGGGEGGADVDADLAGTWTLTESTVEFAHAADTFVRDVLFTAERNRLRAEETFSTMTLRVVLTK